MRLSTARPEKRRLMRFRVVDLHATSSLVDVVLRDLSAQGMSIESRRPLRVGASYPFKIREGRDSEALTGAVKWCKLQRMIEIGGGESQALYRSGIAFSEPLNNFLPPVKSAASRSRVGPEPTPPVDAIRRRTSPKCPDCELPAVVGAKRCRICGTLLPLE